MGNGTSNEPESKDDDCCDSFCNCFTSGCSPLFSIHQNINNDVVIDIAAKIYAIPVQIQSQTPNLFISTSYTKLTTDSVCPKFGSLNYFISVFGFLISVYSL